MDTTRRAILGASVGLVAASVGGLALVTVEGQGRGRGRGQGPNLEQAVKGRLKAAIKKMQARDAGQVAAGALEARTTLLLLADTVVDTPLIDVLRRANPQEILRGRHDHAEINRLAEELGVDPAQLPATDTPKNREALLALLQQPGGFASFIRQAAETLEETAKHFETTKAKVVTVAARQQCGACQQTYDQLMGAENFMTLTCAAAAAATILCGPCDAPLVTLCGAAILTWMTFYTAYMACSTFFGPDFAFC
jgi:hypothetical protein